MAEARAPAEVLVLAAAPVEAGMGAAMTQVSPAAAQIAAAALVQAKAAPAAAAPAKAQAAVAAKDDNSQQRRVAFPGSPAVFFTI
jgi:hypothetical protein